MSDAVIFLLVFAGFFILRAVAATIFFFCILPQGDRCPKQDLKGSKNVAEKLRGAVERQVVIGGKGKPVRAVTVSVGLAHVPSTAGASSAEATIARAGQALAQAKSGGRNRVVLAGEGTP